ncbi:MAG: pyridoxamine 5'-phosphate oxidase family protein [Actinobacteria bacterium]|nr:pyridoxamine 5'-phosphate oxidase family protein [Actinomycetota bacterium]
MIDETLEGSLGDAVATGEARRKAGELLAAAHTGFLALADEEGPYVVPISFAYDGENIYFHGGEGKKSRALEAESRVCLAVTSDAELVKDDDPCSDNFRCDSTLVFGRVVRLESMIEKDAALRTVIAKYHQEAAADPLAPSRVAGTTVYRMEIRAITYRKLPGD